MLSAQSLSDSDQVDPAWFEHLGDSVSPNGNLSLGSLAGENATSDALAGRWIVRLQRDALTDVDSVAQTQPLIDDATVDLQVLRGLGLPGQVLVGTSNTSHDVVAAALAAIRISRRTRRMHLSRDKP